MIRAFQISAILLGLFFTSTANARSIDPGSVWLGAQLGLDSKLGGRVGGSDTLLGVGAELEYALESKIGIYGRGFFELGDTTAVKLEFGSRYRFTGLEMPIVPFVSAHVKTGHLMDVMGANLWTVGFGFGGGADYFLTRRFTAGLELIFDLGTTLGERPAGYNTAHVMLTTRYGF